MARGLRALMDDRAVIPDGETAWVEVSYAGGEVRRVEVDSKGLQALRRGRDHAHCRIKRVKVIG